MTEIARVEHLREKWLSRMGNNAWTLALPFLALVPLGYLGATDERLAALFLGVLAAILAFSVLPLLLLAAPRIATKKSRLAKVELGEAGLSIDGELIPTEELATAWRVRLNEIEVLTRKGDEIRISLDSEEKAEELATAIRERCARDKSYALTGGSPYLRMARQMFGWTVPLTLGALVSMATPWLLPAIALGGAAGWAFAKGERRVRFGADGVSIEGRFKTRYVPYRDIVSVQPVNIAMGLLAVRLTLSDGEQLLIHSATSRTRARLMCSIIEEGVAMAELGASAGAHVPGLARGADEDDETLARKLATVTNESGYRGPAVHLDKLVMLMRNPAADPDQRVAAAFALRETEEGRGRIRVAAEVSAEPAVRDALEALALEELEEPAAKRLLRALGR